MENPAEKEEVTLIERIKEWYSDNGVAGYGLTAVAVIVIVFGIILIMDRRDDRLKSKQDVIEDKIEDKEEYIDDTYDFLIDSLQVEVSKMQKELDRTREDRAAWKSRYYSLKNSQKPIPNEVDGVSTAMFDTLDVVKQASKISRIIYRKGETPE